MRHICTLGMFLASVGCASTGEKPVPEIDGRIGTDEWRAAETYPLPDGGVLRLQRIRNDLYVAVSTRGAGFPTIFIGNEERVSVLHASAAQASVDYSRSGSAWTAASSKFEYTLRQEPSGAQASESVRRDFLDHHGWLSTSDRGHGPDREFIVKLGPQRRFLAISVLGLPSMNVTS